MNENKLKKCWESEEAAAHIHGWDFSHIHGRYAEETDLPWNYGEIIKTYLNVDDKLLDIDTGGGEFLLSLNHPANKTCATECYLPNVELCQKTLIPLGINFKKACDCSMLPFKDEEFDIIINRHGDFDIQEIYRILKKGGLFVTEQVGENNDRELVNLLLPGIPKPFNGLNLEEQSKNFQKANFTILRGEEAYRPIRFLDIGALIWFAKIIEWEFPDFSVEKCYKELLQAQKILENTGSVDGTIHRYLMVAQKGVYLLGGQTHS
jgi:SAM-dependent methyltransferase